MRCEAGGWYDSRMSRFHSVNGDQEAVTDANAGQPFFLCNQDGFDRTGHHGMTGMRRMWAAIR